MVKMILFLAMCKVLCIAIILPILILYWRRKFAKRRAQRTGSKTIVGIFHPYCNAGGGGERVLWEAVIALQKEYEF